MPGRPIEEEADKRPQADVVVARAWVKPSLIEYGHLAKLTRGASGLRTEAGGMMAGCL